MNDNNEYGVSNSNLSLYAPLATALRILSVDMIEKAQSGHPGLPLGIADVVSVLCRDFLKFDPTSPSWPDRDRFILSAGHGSAMLYAMLHLLGADRITIDHLKSFRQLNSSINGHPEYNPKLGVEMTTGPLGQGLASAVGMALAERLLKTRFGSALFSHYTYVLVSDGDLMEGISHEAIHIAGHLNLPKLIVLYDSNQISIDGDTHLTDSGNVAMRFRAAGWEAVVINGHDYSEIHDAIEQARLSLYPSLIVCQTKIGRWAPTKEGKSIVHGAPLGEEEARGLRENLNCKTWQPFCIPDSIVDSWRMISMRHIKKRKQWEELYSKEVNEKTNHNLKKCIEQKTHDNFLPVITKLKKKILLDEPNESTRQSSENVIATLVPIMPELIGGSADLSASTGVKPQCMKTITPSNFSGTFIHYGIREHGMAACMNGLSLHGPFIPYGSTFLIFSDYCKPAIRLSALMKKQVIYIMTHDSIGLGEDGPTHQPIEQLVSLRSIPNLHVFRPCDALEVLECWQLMLSMRHCPSVLVLTRQGVQFVERDILSRSLEENRCARGACELIPAYAKEKVTLMASGSEVQIAVAAQKILEQKEGIGTRVVSMPSLTLFEQQNDEIKESILKKKTLRIAIEAGSYVGWDRYITNSSCFIGISSFGKSAPAGELFQHFDITKENIVKKVKENYAN